MSATPMSKMVEAAIKYIRCKDKKPATPGMLYLALTGGQSCSVTKTAFAQFFGRAAQKENSLDYFFARYTLHSGGRAKVCIYYRRLSDKARREAEALARELDDAGCEWPAEGLCPIFDTTDSPAQKEQLGEFAVATPPRFDMWEAGTYVPPTSLPAARAGADDHLRHKSHGLRC